MSPTTVVSSTILTPPTSTLFPYTTLFRSDRDVDARGAGGGGGRLDPHLAPDEAGAADDDGASVHGAPHAVGGDLGDVVGCRHLHALSPGRVDDGRGERVARVLLHRRRETEQLRRAHTRTVHGGDARLAVGQGAGLVEGDRAHPGQLLQRPAALDDDAVARRA